ncbi:MAG: proton-conducting transporter membrane subunit, partial [Pseudomonadota bacterium]
FIVAGLSLVGVPFTAGFISKYLLIEAAFEATLPVSSLFIVLLIVASSLLAVGYIGRVAYEMFLSDPPEGVGPAKVPLSMLIPLGVVTAANVYFGMDAEGITALARQGADLLNLEGATW